MSYFIINLQRHQIEPSRIVCSPDTLAIHLGIESYTAELP